MRTLGYRFGRARVREAASSLLRQAPSVLRLFGRLMTDARVSTIDRALVGAVIAYVLSPWDLIPDFFAIIGIVDDLFLLGIALERLLMRAPAEVVEEHWDGTPEGLGALSAELQAIGEALPSAIRSVLQGRVDRDSWGYLGEDAGEVWESEEGGRWAEAAGRRPAGGAAGRGPAARGRRPAGSAASASDVYDDDEEYGDDRMDSYRNRL